MAADLGQGGEVQTNTAGSDTNTSSNFLQEWWSHAKANYKESHEQTKLYLRQGMEDLDAVAHGREPKNPVFFPTMTGSIGGIGRAGTFLSRIIGIGKTAEKLDEQLEQIKESPPKGNTEIFDQPKTIHGVETKGVTTDGRGVKYFLGVEEDTFPGHENLRSVMENPKGSTFFSYRKAESVDGIYANGVLKDGENTWYFNNQGVSNAEEIKL